jgi:cystathionine beta-lyase/cystathionine gamma-synthase
LQKPLDLGADIVMHSATKYLEDILMLLQGINCKRRSLENNYTFNNLQLELHWDQWMVSWCLEE